MNKDIYGTLSRFGFSEFRLGQKEAITYLLNGHNTLVVMPTGIGKSLIFQLVATYLPGLTLVISPLIALMKDQVDKLEKLGIPATFINSSLEPEEQTKRLTRMMNGEYKLIYVAPERLRQSFFNKRIRKLPISLLAVDEAHCISQWGHDFRPDYLHISKFRQEVGEPVTVVLTATATPRVRREIVQLLDLSNAESVITGFNRKNIKFIVQRIHKKWKPDDAKRSELAAHLKGWSSGTAIVYAGRRKEAEEAAWFLREVIGVRARHYHSKLTSAEREEVQNEFIKGNLPVIVATNAFGMGIDRPDVRLVLHLTMPGSIEAYYQEAGRAGRDGEMAKAVLLYSPTDKSLHDHFIENSILTYSDLHKIYKFIVKESRGRNNIWINPDDLSNRCGFDDEEGVKIRVGLQRLEEAGAIEQWSYQGFDRLIKIGSWNTNDVQEVVSKINKHSEHKRHLLSQMIAYGENNTICRRTFLLQYFNDSQVPASQFKCCDVCDLNGFVGSLSSVGQAVYECIRDNNERLTRFEVRRVLMGIPSKELSKAKHFGRLSSFDKGLILQEIDFMLKDGIINRNKQKYLVIGSSDSQDKRKKIHPSKKINRSEPQTSVPIQRKDANYRLNSSIQQIIIECVQNLNGQLSRNILSMILVGSTSPKVGQFDDLPHFGQLKAFTRQAVKDEIELLIQNKKLALDAKHRVIVFNKGRK